MPIFSQLIGVGPNSEILTCAIKVELSQDGKKATLSFKNTSPYITGYSEPVIEEVFLNLHLDSKLLSNDIKMENSEKWDFCHLDIKDGKIDDENNFRYKISSKQEKWGTHPDQILSFSLYSEDQNFSFDQDMFLYNSSDENQSDRYSIGVNYKNLLNKKKEKKLICGHFIKRPLVVTTPPPPPSKIPNPQTCCQILIKGETQLVGPALYNPKDPCQYPITHTKKIHTWIEAVCPEKVVITGFIKKKIEYKVLDKSGNVVSDFTEDEIPFHCMMDRPDANEGDSFEITGAAILCDIMAQPANFGLHPEFGKPVAWKFVEKEIIKVCIRKKHSAHHHQNPHH
jgi:hypothetical protein